MTASGRYRSRFCIKTPTVAHLGIARAANIGGDQAKARKEYQDFFALWKDADQDLPILIKARKEYEQMK